MANRNMTISQVAKVRWRLEGLQAFVERRSEQRQTRRSAG